MEIEEKDMRKKEMRIGIQLLSEKELNLLQKQDKDIKKWRATHEKIYNINHKGQKLIVCDTSSIQSIINLLKKGLGEI